jgi:hypothetical protein
MQKKQKGRRGHLVPFSLWLWRTDHLELTPDPGTFLRFARARCA